MVSIEFNKWDIYIINPKLEKPENKKTNSIVIYYLLVDKIF